MAEGAEPYRVVLRPAAARDLRNLPRDVVRRIDPRIASLAVDPLPRGAVKLAGEESLYRIRVGDYRIIYEKNDALRLVTIARIRHRRDVYR